MCVRVKRDMKGPLPVRVRIRFRLSGILSGFPFSDILSENGLLSQPFVRDSIWLTPRKSAGNH